MAETVGKETLYRKLAQTRRLIAGPLDLVTIDRLKVYCAELERQLAENEAREADAPPE
jgi:hypothetical protein